jgi:hypothetical protein
MRPHISGIARMGFLKQDAFRLLPKDSGANIHWANANHTFLTHKNPQILRDISPDKLCSTAWAWNPQGISKLMDKVDCRVSCPLLNGIVQAFLATNPFAVGSSTYVVGSRYSVQYKSIFGAPDKVRRNTCEEARPSRLDFQRDKAVLGIKSHHVIALMEDCWP